jgi:hypothetical protein
MKRKKIELDVDFIGGQDPLTHDEEKALSDFFNKRKAKSAKYLIEHKAKRSKLLA